LGGEQLANFQGFAAVMIQKMNSSRDTFERPKLEAKDCILLR